MNIPEIYENALAWYKKQATWKKVVFFLFLVVLAVLGIVYAVYQTLNRHTADTTPTEVDSAHSRVVDDTVAQSRAAQKKLETELNIKKTEALHLAQERIKDAQQQKDVRDVIANAKTFDEVDVAIKALKR
jgi:hypothetical protein